MIRRVEITRRIAQKMTSGGVITYHGTSYCVVPQFTVQDVKEVARTKSNARLKTSFFFI